MQELQLIIFLLFILITTAIFSPGDRISTLTQVSHRGWKTPYADVAIENMPRFQYSAKSVIRVTLPSENRDSKEEANIDPNYDVKVSLTFSENKLIIPQIYLFDSKERKSLQKLIVTFHHDKYELQRLNYETIYGPKIMKLDPSHPSLTAFDIIYQWESEQEIDFAFTITVMFTTTVIIVLGIIALIWHSHPLNDPRRRKEMAPIYPEDSPRSQLLHSNQMSASSSARKSPLSIARRRMYNN